MTAHSMPSGQRKEQGMFTWSSGDKPAWTSDTTWVTSEGWGYSRMDPVCLVLHLMCTPVPSVVERSISICPTKGRIHQSFMSEKCSLSPPFPGWSGTHIKQHLWEVRSLPSSGLETHLQWCCWCLFSYLYLVKSCLLVSALWMSLLCSLRFLFFTGLAYLSLSIWLSL